MPLDIYPPATVSRSWTLLASSTSTGVTTYTFSSLPAYNFYRIRVANLETSSSDVWKIKFNNDTTSRNNLSILSQQTYAQVTSTTDTTGIQVSRTSTTQWAGEFIIDNSGTYTTLKSDLVYTANTPSYAVNGIWLGNAQINRLDIYCSNSTSVNSGIYIFGSNV